MDAILDFEKPIVNLEHKLQDLRQLAQQEGVDFSSEIHLLEKKVHQLIDDTYAKLTPWQRVQLSRHPQRPYTRDYIDLIFPDFMELKGDRAFGDDEAILGGIATFPGFSPEDLDPPKTDPLAAHSQPFSVMIIGHQKGRTTQQKRERNFGMAKPEGYRKSMRLMSLANRSQMPILTLIDTPGAYPGVEAEERGQAAAIAESIELMFTLEVPTVAVVIGEGGSGGALAIGAASRVLMLEYSTYSVISPESCASILWSDSGLCAKASEKLKMSAPELLKHRIIDDIIREPKGGAHRSWPEASHWLRKGLIQHLAPLLSKRSHDPQALMRERIEKFRHMGAHAFTSRPQESGETSAANPTPREDQAS